MIRSMTGYGSARGSCAGLELKIEVRSVNNRFLDCSVRLPRNLLFAEEIIKSRVQERLSRGKVDVYVTVERAAGGDMAVAVNHELAGEYAMAIRELSRELELHEGFTAYDIARFPEVLSLEKRDPDQQAAGEAVAALTEAALTDFDAMRRREGDKLAADVAGRLDAILLLVGQVEERSPQTVEEYRARLYKKMCEVLEKPAVDEQRILLEAAVYADKVAVDEETVRLRSHVEQMRSMLSAGSPIGRKMDFLIQEFNREANTIGSKCSDQSVTRTVIELKGEIEKIREQIQNIE